MSLEIILILCLLGYNVYKNAQFNKRIQELNERLELTIKNPVLAKRSLRKEKK